MHNVWTNGQPEQDIEVYSLWVCRFGRGAAHTQNVHALACAHTYTHNRGSVPAGGQSLPSSYTFILSLSLLPVIPPFRCHTPPHLPPLDLSFSFIPHSFSCDKRPLPLLKRGKKESVKDTEELANSNEKLGGRGQNHHRGQLWLGLCTYTCVCVCVWFLLGLIVLETLRTVLEATICPSGLFCPLLLSSIPPSLRLLGPSSPSRQFTLSLLL